MWNKKRSLFLQYKSKKIDGRYEMPAVLFTGISGSNQKGDKARKIYYHGSIKARNPDMVE